MAGERRLGARVLVAIVLAIAIGGAVVLAAGALAALPALLIPLLAGRYLGADRLEALIERRRARARRAKPAAPAGFRIDTSRPRGSQLLGFALAERGPPTPAVS